MPEEMKMDLDELQVAAAASANDVIRSHGWKGMIADADLLRTDERYLLLADPATVLSLIAEVKALRRDAERYQVLRQADIDTIENGGLFAGLTPDNLVINGHDLDVRTDEVIALRGRVTP
ncbi:hypothetical protein [Pseudomonas sp.]|uniref:hypothetical protein n=1 Tax=Pseudomonas sp. TaxID=306 RepID=UPI003BAF1D4D